MSENYELMKAIAQAKAAEDNLKIWKKEFGILEAANLKAVKKLQAAEAKLEQIDDQLDVMTLDRNLWRTQALEAQAKADKYQQWYDEEEAKVVELKAALDRVRSITVESMATAYWEAPAEAIDMKGIKAIHRLLTERMEGK